MKNLKRPMVDGYLASRVGSIIGSDLRTRIQAGQDEETIRASWQEGLRACMKVREKYLLYDDFSR
jgi:uncharacterized protein YbbC (DUF1343 family)